ncbi:MAG TPA: alpha/beta fold hydrolase, partial [Dehalococcoidia bacterium]|nr:alpha/beta fold hydrolase [Dehalococcoidia bacterium]
RDLLGAVDFLRARFPHAPIAVYGVSMGGSVALQAAAEDERIGAVAADCAFTTLSDMVAYRRRTQFTGLRAPAFHLSRRAAELMSGARIHEFRPLDVVHRIAPRPVFLMHSERDVLVPPEHFERFLERLPIGTERWLIPGCGHAAGSSERADEYVERLAGFFRRALARHDVTGPDAAAPSRPDQR